jgi:cellulose synthase (UDP-forming)
MAVVARGVRSARPATAPKHRKTSTPPEPSPPDKPGSSDKSGATRQQDTPAAPDATLELPAVDQPDALERLTAAAPPGTNGRPKPGALDQVTAPAEPDRRDRPRLDTQERLTTPGQLDPLPRPATPGKPEARDWFTPAPAQPGTATLPQPETRERPAAPSRPDPADRAAPGQRATRNRAARPSEAAASRSQAATTHRRAAREAGDDAPSPVLPVPPKDHEKWTYIRRHMWVLTLCSALSFPPLVYSQYRMVENSPWFLIYAPFALFGIMTFLLSMVVDGMSRSFDLAEHKRIVAGWLPLWYPSVDVFLPVCGEPIEVLRNAWNHVAVLRNRYPGQVTPYVLDDSADPKLKAMARRFGFAYATRPDRGWFKKSGNLRYGFSISNGDYILLLDADFAPRADLLDETIPYLDMFPDIGIVQTPQFFRVLDEQTWVERGAGAIQELFYRSIQTARAKKGGAICVGSCAVYRRSALEQNKGISLAEHSEDLHTGFDLYRLGYKLRYLPIALSTGVCPDNILAFLNQQYRWCSGTMSLMRDKKFWKTKLPLYMRLCYLTGLVGYVYTAVFTFVAPALAIGMLLFVPGQLLMRNLIFIAPVLFYAGVIYPMWHRAPYRLEAWSVRVISGWAHLFAFTDMLRGRLRGWQPSGSGSKRQDGRRRLWIGLIGWSAGSAALWVGLALWRMMTMNPYNFFLIFVLGLFQLVVVGRILIQPRAGAT